MEGWGHNEGEQERAPLNSWNVTVEGWGPHPSHLPVFSFKDERANHGAWKCWMSGICVNLLTKSRF